MKKFKYSPDSDIPIHKEHAIKLMCRSFQSHESGLPEWIKNSSDAYVREDVPEKRRVVILIFNNNRKNFSQSISCLDFAGMTSEMIEKYFRIWADPTTARGASQSDNIQGGHGNGGKCYMTQMFDDYSYLYSVKNNLSNWYGVSGSSINFGYIPDREKGRNVLVKDLSVEFEKALKEIGISSSILPKNAMTALKSAKGFTLLTGLGPKGYKNKIPIKHLIDNLQHHPQMMISLDLCKIYIVINGRLDNDGKPLSLSEIAPMEGAEDTRLIPIPDKLVDPLNDEKISTTDSGDLPLGKLILKTSKTNMRYFKKLRHNIIYRSLSGYIGYIPVSELDIQSAYRDKIYGECVLEALEPFKQNERARLANSPLTRAVEAFISDQIQKYAKEFELRDQRHYSQKERNAVSEINEILDKWKNRFLNELMKGLWGKGPIGPPQPPPPLPSGIPERLELSVSYNQAGLGISIRPALKFFDKDGRRIRPVPYRWVSEDNNIAMVDEDLMLINTFSYGETMISAETIDGKKCSNKVPLEVIKIHEINIEPSEIEIPSGSRFKFNAICKLPKGEESINVYLEWTENNSSIARVSSSGMVYTFAPGETEIMAGDDKCSSKNQAKIKVLEGQKGRGEGKKKGRGYPLVQVSGEGFDRDPDTNEYVFLSSDEPPVHQRVQDADRNIWWINTASPLARLYLDKNKGYGYNTREWRMYHLERYIDIIIQISMIYGPDEIESLSVNDWISRWGSQAAEIQAAVVSDLDQFINTGELPQV